VRLPSERHNRFFNEWTGNGVEFLRKQGRCRAPRRANAYPMIMAGGAIAARNLFITNWRPCFFGRNVP
jgi:hypothetical protein